MATDRSCEIRFGLVMYGGVSLAIYINGVTHEFCRAVRGNGPYKLLKDLVDSDIVVDIISGTSAGGINGIFLSYALANNRDFGAMAELWREHGDISKLLYAVNAGGPQYDSLLNSDGYYKAKLKDALDTLPDYRGESDYDPSNHDIDLFVTGTNIEGDTYTVFDDDGHLIDVKDHRSIFCLKHRQNRKTPFDPAMDPLITESLATLARITSSFPAAFAPVHMISGLKLQHEAEPTVDGHLRMWGDYTKEAYFLDGGVLVNKPFTSTINAIFRRTADVPVVRRLCYVEPDPDFFVQRAVSVPTFITATLDGAVGIKSYESIADDLKRVSEHNSQVDRYRQVSRKLRGSLPVWPFDVKTGYNGVVLPTERILLSLQSEANPNRVFNEGTEVKPGEGSSPPGFFTLAQREQYMRSRFTAMGSRALKGLFKDSDSGKAVRIDNPQDRARAADLVAELIDLKPDDDAPDVLSDEESLFRFDIYFRLRRIYHVVYRINDESASEPNSPVSILAWQALWRCLNLHIEVGEIVRYWMEYVMDHAKIPWTGILTAREIWADLRCCLEDLLVVNEGPPVLRVPRDQAELATFHAALADRAKKICSKDASEPKGVLRQSFRGLLDEMDEAVRKEFNGHADIVTKFRDEFIGFVALDAMVYPLELVSDLQGKDSIQILRISPRDAQTGFSHRDISEKIAGRSLSHFGGFFKRSWRSNDILWGRLDCVCELFENVLTKDRLEEIRRKDFLRRKVAARFIKPNFYIASQFPHSSSETVERIEAWIHDLFNGDNAAFDDALSRTVQMRCLIIEMAQLELLYECVPPVIADATQEQADWNQYAVPLTESGFIEEDTKIMARSREFLTLDSDIESCRIPAFCIQLAHWTRQNMTRMDRLWRALIKNKDRVEWWNSSSTTPGLTNGQEAIDEAIRASYESLANSLRPSETFQPTRGFVDPAVASLAADQYARASIAALTPARSVDEPLESPMGVFFRQRYNVGAETVLSGLPWMVLLEIFARASLVLRNCVLAALPGGLGEKIRKHLLFRLGFDYPLRFVYWTVQFARQQPSVLLVLHASVFTLFITLIAVAWFARSSLFFVGGKTGWSNFIWFLGLPLIGLYVLLRLTELVERKRILLLVSSIVAVIADLAVSVWFFARLAGIL